MARSSETTPMTSNLWKMLSWPCGTILDPAMKTQTMTCVLLEKTRGVTFRETWQREQQIGCEVLAKTEYISNICKDHDIEVTDRWYEHESETVMYNKDNNITIIWDMPVNTNRTIAANRPDIMVKDSVNSTCKLIYMTIPSDRNIALKELEKKCKYRDLELEIQRMWQMKTEVIPVVVGSLGTRRKGMGGNIKEVSERATVTETQKINILRTVRLLRKNVCTE